MKKRILIAVTFAVLLVVVAASSSMLTLMVADSYSARSGDRVTVSKQDYQRLLQYARLGQIQSIVEDEFVEDVDAQLLVDGAAYGMLDVLGDPYTFYYVPEAMTEMQEHVQGQYAGIGCQLTIDPEDRHIVVTRTFKGSPGEKSDIRKMDKIIRVNGEDFVGQEQLSAAVSRMKGEPGTSVTLTIRRGTEEMEKTVVRDVVTINRIEYEMLDEDIGYVIQYEFFGDDVTGFNEALKFFRDNGAKGFIYDVRDDPGGSVTDAVGIVDALCPEGIAVYTENKRGERQFVEYSTGGGVELPFVVLVNENSASAAEIVAGAVQDYGVGKLVGTTTFGKGIVQTVHTFKEDNAGMQITSAYWFTPKGRNIHGTGLEPDVYVEMPSELIENPLAVTRENDAQLLTGMEVLRGMIGGQDSQSGE